MRERRKPWIILDTILIPSGKLTFCYGKSPFLMGKSTISMAMFNSYVELPEGKSSCAKSMCGCTMSIGQWLRASDIGRRRFQGFSKSLNSAEFVEEHTHMRVIWVGLKTEYTENHAI